MGLIARYIHTFLAATGWSFGEIGVHDLSAEHAAGFRGYLEQAGAAGRITVHDGAEQLIRSSDLVVFATVAGQPHVTDVSWFKHNPLVLHVSLRDLAPEILLASDQHRRRRRALPEGQHVAAPGRAAHGRPGLPGRHAGRRDGRADNPARRAGRWCSRRSAWACSTSRSASYVYDQVRRSGELHVIDGFFHELRRYG